MHNKPLQWDGLGRPVVDLFKKKQLYPKAITITGGYDVIKDNGEYKVPKRDLVTNLQVVFQQEKLKIAEGLPEANTLVQELLNFKVKIKDNARESFEAWREGIHDDLVLAVALACWWGEKMDKKIELWWYRINNYKWIYQMSFLMWHLYIVIYKLITCNFSK